MKEEDVIRLAIKAKLPHYWESKDIVNLEGVTRFAKLVAAHEREACAKVCDDIGMFHEVSQGADLCFELGKAIRARGDNQ